MRNCTYRAEINQYVQRKFKQNQIKMKKPTYIVAIDPDVEKSGYALINTDTKELKEISAITFPDLMEVFSYFKAKKLDCIILVEASWLQTTNNWHLSPKDTKQSAAAKGNRVGRNQETGRKIIEMAKHYGLPTETVIPFTKGWRGTDGKISHEELAYFVPGLPARTNSEMRDACLIAWNYAGYAIKVQPIKSKSK